MADADRMLLTYGIESAFGEVPGSATLKELRYTRESLHLETQTAQSGEIRPDRQVTSVQRLGITGAGELAIEFPYGAHDDLLQAALISQGWSTPETVGPATMSMVDSGGGVWQIEGVGSPFGDINLHQWIRVSGFNNAGNNGIFKVVGKPDDNTLVVIGSDSFEAEVATSGVTVVMGAQIVNGVDTPSVFFEKQFTDVGFFEVIRGTFFDQFSLSIAAGSLNTGSFQVMGRDEIRPGASVGVSVQDAPTNEITNAVDHIVAIITDGGLMDATSLSFQLQNRLRARQNIGVLGAVSFGKGTIELTGTLQSYFEREAEVNKYLNFTTTNLAVVTRDNGGNSYVFDFPQMKFTQGQTVAGGQNTDILADMQFTAFRNPVEDVTVRIARFPGS